MLNQRNTLLIGSLLSFLSVAFGAFGAHALKSILIENNKVDTYELAVKYLFFHAIAMILLSILMDRIKMKAVQLSATFIFCGTVGFSGSLFVMAIFNTTSVVFITPIGGALLLAGWSFLGYAAFVSKT